MFVYSNMYTCIYSVVSAYFLRVLDIFLCMYSAMNHAQHMIQSEESCHAHDQVIYGVASDSSIDKIIGLFSKRAL